MTDKTNTPTPEALRLAAWLQEGAWHQMRLGDVEAAGRELRRQHARIAELETMLAAAPQAAPAPLIARSLAEWHEDDGYVAWWAWNGREWAGEPAWIGSPNCEDWPGYHTHWTPHPVQPSLAQGGA